MLYDAIRYTIFTCDQSWPIVSLICHTESRNQSKRVMQKLQTKTKMLRRNGPVIKSVESVMRLEESLWWERFLKGVGFEQGVKERGSYGWWEWWVDRVRRCGIGAWTGKSETEALACGWRREHGVLRRNLSLKYILKVGLFCNIITIISNVSCIWDMLYLTANQKAYLACSFNWTLNYRIETERLFKHADCQLSQVGLRCKTGMLGKATWRLTTVTT